MKNTVLIVTIVASIISFTSCSKVGEKNTSYTGEKTTKPLAANKLLTVEIEGMVCEKGCGSSIRKGLLATGGVTKCSFDYQEKRAKNTALIEFDKDKVTADELIQTISSLNNHQFKVASSRTQFLETKIQPVTIESNASDKSTNIQLSESRIEMPNLITLFSRLIHQN